MTPLLSAPGSAKGSVATPIGIVPRNVTPGVAAGCRRYAELSNAQVAFMRNFIHAMQPVANILQKKWHFHPVSSWQLYGNYLQVVEPAFRDC
jgi:hypothetical protein